jgi:hypothetical protein
MYRGSRHLGKITGPIPRPYVPASAARVRNASVGAGPLVVKVGTSKAGGTISQQAVVHPWLAADAHGNKQKKKTGLHKSRSPGHHGD